MDDVKPQPEAYGIAPAVDPAEAIATTLPVNRNFAIKRPGHIAWAAENGNYPGCRLLVAQVDANGGLLVDGASDEESQRIFDSNTTIDSPADYINEFFRQHGGLLVVHMSVGPRSVAVLFTNQLEGEELEEFNEFSATISLHMQEWRKKRDEEKEAQRMKELEVQQEAKEILELGKKAKEHNLFNKLRELEKLVARYETELKEAKREAKRDAKKGAR